MTTEIQTSITIDAPAAVVRAQFGDVAHHEAQAVHKGVRFRVIDDDGSRCRYEQKSRVGPITTTQTFELERTADGPLVNRVTGGMFAGGAIIFNVVALDDHRSRVDATLRADLKPAPVAALLRGQVRRSLAKALLEDKADIESGRYSAAN